MQIMTKINDFEEILFESSIIFHVFARLLGTEVSLKSLRTITPKVFLCHYVWK